MTAPRAIANAGADRLHVEPQFDSVTGTVSYIVLDRSSGSCALIDTVLDYSAGAARISHAGADRLAARVLELGAKVEWILETHVHADHLSAAPYLKAKLGGRIGIGAHIRAVQETFGAMFHGDGGFASDGAGFCSLFEDDARFAIGTLDVTVMHTPGHTPACVSYIVSDGDASDACTRHAAFVGDTLFMPDFGTARCDFPGGDARQLYRSIARLLRLSDDTLVYTGHDYPPGGRAPAFRATVAEQRDGNIHLRGAVTEDAFVAMRTARDATLAVPALILPSVQVNMRGGQLPDADATGRRYLKIPLDVF